MLSDEEKYKQPFQESLNGFASVSEDSFAKLFTLAKFRTVKKGEFILSKGQTARKIYFACEGVLISKWMDPI